MTLGGHLSVGVDYSENLNWFPFTPLLTISLPPLPSPWCFFFFTHCPLMLMVSIDLNVSTPSSHISLPKSTSWKEKISGNKPWEGRTVEKEKKKIIVLEDKN